MSASLVILLTIAAILFLTISVFICVFLWKSYTYLSKAVSNQNYMDTHFFPKLIEHFNRSIETLENKRDKIGLNKPESN